MKGRWIPFLVLFLIVAGVAFRALNPTDVRVLDVIPLHDKLDKKPNKHGNETRLVQKETSSDQVLILSEKQPRSYEFEVPGDLRIELSCRVLAGPTNQNVDLVVRGRAVSGEMREIRSSFTEQDRGRWSQLVLKPEWGVGLTGLDFSVELMGGEAEREDGAAREEIILAVVFPRVWYEREIEFKKRSDARQIVFITLDTVRADHLACYGNKEVKTPNLDRLSKDGVLFRDAYSVTNITNPSHSAMFTSLYLKDHQVLDNFRKLGESTPTLIEMLDQAGFDTAAFVAAYVFDPERCDFSRRFGKFYACRDYPQRRAAEVNADVIPWLNENHHQDFFIWVHYFDAHFPYNPPVPYDRMYGGKKKGSPTEDELPVEDLRDLYKGEISYLDSQVGVLLQQLKDLDIYDNCLLVVVADHGELIGEQGVLHDHKGLRDPVTHVPLLIKMPGSRFEGEVHGLVSTLDLYPTIFDVFNLDLTHQVRGESVLPVMERLGSLAKSVETGRSEVFGEHAKYLQVSIRTDESRFVLGLVDKTSKDFSTVKGKEELFKSGPTGEEPISVDESKAARYRTTLTGFLADRLELGAEDIKDPKFIKAIEELGYVKDD